MSVVLAIAGKKYTVTSNSVDVEILAQAGKLFDAAAAEISLKEPLLSEGQLCAMVAMRCIVPLLQEKVSLEVGLESLSQQISEVLKDR
jgi:cell division protein ZapA (FtsZ GTPase activity inhibitor)